ncbi:hypothetical protein EON65_22865 [archaeon]|nr:MAG: hypothetical protein EON65_22865 [archaeon]
MGSYPSYGASFCDWLQKAVLVQRNRQGLQDLQRLVKLRTGGKGNSIWYYQGVLRSSMTGDEIAGIEGMEIVRLQNSSYNFSTNTRQSSYLSKKTFIYVDKSNHTQPLERYRKQKVAPARATKPLKVIEELVTLSCSPHHFRPLNATITWPGGRQLHSRKLLIRTNTLQKRMLDRLLGKQQVDVMHSSTGLVPSPLLWRLISFSSPSASNHGKTKEYYTILHKGHVSLPRWPSFNQFFQPESIVQMSYRRFGESPPWFAVNRGAIIELQGYRYDRLRHMPREIRGKLSVLMPMSLQEDYSLTDFRQSTDPLSLYAPWYHKLWGALQRKKISG